MVGSDDEYVQDISDEEIEAHQVTRGAGASSRATGQGSRGGGWEGTLVARSLDNTYVLHLLNVQSLDCRSWSGQCHTKNPSKN